MGFIYKALEYVYRFIWYSVLAKMHNYPAMKANGVKIKSDYEINGFMYFKCHKTSNVIISSGFRVNSGFLFNTIGRQQVTSIIAKKDAQVYIGKNVGMSSATLVALKKITIGDNVRIGGNVVIYDSDFHSLVVEERTSIPEITDNIRCKEVQIDNNVFIGAHVTILKGSHIGENSIVGTGSVVSGIIPANEVWAGNPARFIKKLYVLK